MNSAPLISVIIPIYNGQDFVSECLESVIEQTYSKFEIIIVDDGSTDKSVSIIESFSSKTNISIILQKNGDVSKARNVGIENSNGELIAFLDQDDTWLNDKLEKAVEIFNSYSDTHLVFHDITKIFPSGKTHRAKDKHQIALSLNDDNLFKRLVVKNVLMPSAVVVRKESILEAGLFDTDFKTCGDYEMWLRMALLKMKFKYLPEPLTLYRIHPNNNSNKTEIMFKDRIKAVEKSFSDHRIQADDKSYKSKGLSAAYMQGANEFFSKKDYSKFLDNAQIAFSLNKQILNFKNLSRYIRSWFFLKIGK